MRVRALACEHHESAVALGVAYVPIALHFAGLYGADERWPIGAGGGLVRWRCGSRAANQRDKRKRRNGRIPHRALHHRSTYSTAYAITRIAAISAPASTSEPTQFFPAMSCQAWRR